MIYISFKEASLNTQDCLEIVKEIEKEFTCVLYNPVLQSIFENCLNAIDDGVNECLSEFSLNSGKDIPAWYRDLGKLVQVIKSAN